MPKDEFDFLDPDFIQSYIEGTPYWDRASRYTIEIPMEIEGDPFDYITAEQVYELEGDRLKWFRMRYLGAKDLKKEHYEFIRDQLDIIFNEYGGYMSRPFTDMKYAPAQLALLVPQGVYINAQETYRAWKGMETSFGITYINDIAREMLSTGLLQWLDKGEVIPKYNAKAWYYRYVVVERKDVFPYDYNANEIVDALLTTIHMIGRLVPFPLGPIINWLQLGLKWLVQLNTRGPYPILLNMGFYGTTPWQVIRYNWKPVIQMIDEHFSFKPVYDYEIQSEKPTEWLGGGDEGGTSPPSDPTPGPGGPWIG